MLKDLAFTSATAEKPPQKMRSVESLQKHTAIKVIFLTKDGDDGEERLKNSNSSAHPIKSTVSLQPKIPFNGFLSKFLSSLA